MLFGKARYLLVSSTVNSIYLQDVMLHRLYPSLSIKFSAREFDGQFLQFCVKHARHDIGNNHFATLFCKVSLPMNGDASCRSWVHDMTLVRINPERS